MKGNECAGLLSGLILKSTSQLSLFHFTVIISLSSPPVLQSVVLTMNRDKH